MFEIFEVMHLRKHSVFYGIKFINVPYFFFVISIFALKLFFKIFFLILISYLKISVNFPSS